ncbi:MAG: hypothetical protein FJW88_03825 [Actinobacteria bacterium]|nr:hypothetical protein [Actinomycetota bacterium]
MDIDLRKTATDAAYILVGAGVLGYQQTQVRRREATARLGELRCSTRDSLGPEALRALADELTVALSSTVGTVSTEVRDTLSTVGQAPAAVDPRPWVEPVLGDLRTRVEPVIEQLKVLPVGEVVSAIPEQLGKAVEMGWARVQSIRG